MTQPQPTAVQPPDLYESDYYAWLIRNAAALRAGRIADADLANIAEELEDMGRSEKRALGSHIAALLLHLLKWQFQPDERSRSRRLSIDNARDAIDELLEESPSLRGRMPDLVQRKYPSARRDAITETGLPPSMFPEPCPFTLADILDRRFPSDLR